jgi:hypothetical protein
MTTAQRIGLRLFIEGIEIPIISASVNSQPNSPATCSIQIPANDYALKFKPRTLVHLFFFDFYNGAPGTSQLFVAGEGLRRQERVDRDPELDGILPPERFESTEEQDLVDRENRNFRLLFGGEIIGISTVKTPTTRAVVLQCLDWSSYWDFAYQYQVRGMSLGGGGIRAAFTGAATNVFNSFLDGSADIVTGLMSRPPRNFPELRGTLLGGLVHLIEAIGGTYFGNNIIRGTNDFFSLAEMRLHLTQQVGANPFPNRDEVRLLRARGFGSLFRRSLSNLGKMVSIRAVINALQKYIFHEVVPIVTPRYIPPGSDPNLPNVERVSLREDPATRSLHRAAVAIKARAEQTKERQESAVDDETAAQASRNLRNSMVRIARFCDRAAARTRNIQIARTSGDSPYAPIFDMPGISEAFASSGSRFNRVLFETRTSSGTTQNVGGFTVADLGSGTSGSSGRSSAQNRFPPANTAAGQRVVQNMDAVITEMDRVLNSTHLRRPRRGTGQPAKPQRLLAHLYRPDVWMVAPPRCNVFFPELYSNFTYSRSFMQETSRLMLRTHSAFFGSDFLFDGFYMAPSRLTGERRGRPIGGGRTGNDPPDISDAPAWFVRDMMNHELYTGIIPAFERMSDLNLHALRGGSTVIGGVRVGYAQLAANHIFFQYRFRSRQLQLTGKFNPFVALGFPAVVIDKYLPQDRLDNAEYDAAIAARLAVAASEGEGLLGGPTEESRQSAIEESVDRTVELALGITEQQPNSHYLGTPVSVMHTVAADQSVGQTQVQMGYSRVSDEETEFLGDDLAQAPRARRRRDATITHRVASLTEPRVGGKGPRGGNITRVQDVTNQYQRRRRSRSPSSEDDQAVQEAIATAEGEEGRTVSLTSEEREEIANRVRRRGRRRYRGNRELPLFVQTTSGVTSGRRRRATRVLVGVEKPAFEYGPEVVALVGGGGTQNAENTLVQFRAFRIQERVGAYERHFIDLPAEELVFPPWYGEHYRTHKIGGLYQYFFGTGSIVDPLSIIEPSNTSVVNPGTGETVQRPERDRELADTDVAPTDGSSTVGDVGGGDSIGEPSTPGETPQTIEEIEALSTIENAIEGIVRAYSVVRHRRFDVNEFIRAYTWRPVADMTDMFGTANLEINDEGRVERGVEGFHSRAFGDFDDLRQLVRNVEGRPSSILGLTIRDPDQGSASDRNRAQRDATIAARLDTRKEKRLQVFRYLHALLASRGILG